MLEQKLSTHLNKLYEARRRRAVYLGFAEDPVAFINAAIASQVGACSIGPYQVDLAFCAGI